MSNFVVDMINESSIAFVRAHLKDDVRTLALQTRRDSDVDLPWALDQIQGWQTARYKLPSWADIDGIIYPPHLSMEQCSSEQTAIYKCGILNRLPQSSRETLVDLTGGFGVDFAFMAKCSQRAVYVERQAHLCETARHNFGLLGLDHVNVIHSEAEQVLNDLNTNPSSTLLYLDPARRDTNNSRTYAISDCTPNVLELKDRLFDVAHRILIKLSPMLDWHKAVNDLGDHVAEVHIVSTANECKELLILLNIEHQGKPVIHCVNDDQQLIYTPHEDDVITAIANDDNATYLYEPNASIMKAGCFGMLTQRYPVKALAADSHLFVSNEQVMDFPGRRFAVNAVTSLNKKELAAVLKGITRANIAVRNFPLSAQELRKRLRLADGGDCYIFGTTNASSQRVLYICQKI